ncbi:hypothetical protein BJV74DRAFT_907587 [Russula compacta]|nr:hypothetical protein BJV74DRAFT_907587 [Russula compacta]
MDDPSIPLLYTPSEREATSSRFSTAFLSTVLILVAFNCLRTAEALLSSYQSQFVWRPFEVRQLGTLAERYAPSSPGFLASSVSWESVEFNLPIDAEVLFVGARGSLSSGIVRVHQSPEVKDLKVSVAAHYHKKEDLSSARVCLVERGLGNGVKGVEILTPFRWIPPRRKDSLFFVVDVTFPSPTHGRVRHVSTFAADVPGFVLDVDDLSGLSFGRFILKSTNSPVTVTSVTGESIVAEGKNGKIEGSFNVTTLLKLSTTNSPINVSLNAHSNVPSEPTVVSLKSTNGALNSNVSLSTNSSLGTGGYFRFYTCTSNAALDVSFSTGPPDSRLVFDGATRNAPAHLALHPAFEGGFLLRTTHFRPTLHLLPGVEDPAGRRREREANKRVVAGRAIIGNVSWVPCEGCPEAEGSSWAGITTSNAPVTLAL